MLNNNKFILNSVLAFSIISLTIAYYIQYVLGHKPCNLCLIERIPYLSAVILIPLIFIINKFEKIIGGILMIFFIFGTVTSFYHVGIEQGVFSESLVCDLDKSGNNLSKDDLLKQLDLTVSAIIHLTVRHLDVKVKAPLCQAHILTLVGLVESY